MVSFVSLYVRIWRTLSFITQKAVNFGNSSVEGYDSKPMIGSVQDQVLAHDGQTDKAKISTGLRLRWSADINAGETRTSVSIELFVRYGCHDESDRTLLEGNMFDPKDCRYLGVWLPLGFSEHLADRGEAP